MSNTSPTPLLSLTALAVDTETTGLDARTARIVDFAAIRMIGGTIEPDAAFDQIIDPQIPIPSSSTAVHGLARGDVAGAPVFEEVAARINALYDGAVVIGHNIGFDLAVLDREFLRAGVAFRMPRFLDVRALARLAAPDLASYSLETLCDWLGIEIGRRHRAMPDALAAARIFAGLVQPLRERGIRTLAEAEQSVRLLPGEQRLFEVGGWVTPAHVPAADPAPVLARIDTLLYRHRVRDLLLPAAPIVPGKADLNTLAGVLTGRHATRAAVILHDGAILGMAAAPDVLAALRSSPDGATLVKDIAWPTFVSVADDDFLYRAVARLQRSQATHLGVVDRRGGVTAVLSAGDLLRHRASSALSLGDAIEAATTTAELGAAWSRVTDVAETCLAEGLAAPDIAAIISAEIRALTAQAARLAEERMRAGGQGGPPCAYAVLVLGSGGRGDSLLSADQDNAIVYETGVPDGAEDRWFAAAGQYLADILNEAGLRYCPGGVMACNAGCRHSAPLWRGVVADWVGQSRAEDLLAADIFFDGVAVFGDTALADDLFSFAFQRAEQSPAFIRALADFAKSWFPPIGLLGQLSLEADGRLDLKRNGLLPVVTAARTLALKHGLRPRGTLQRLAEARGRGLVDGGLADRACAAFGLIQGEILKQQIADAHQGIPLSARVQVSAFSPAGKRALKDAMQAVSALVGATLNV